MATIKLTFRASLSKDKEGTLYYQVIHKQVARQICTGYKIFPSEWNKDDCRTTRWGHILRMTNIDETPQFINVLLGDMSVVGPRPHMVKHTEEFSRIIDGFMIRHTVKPGITGWSQMNGLRGEIRSLIDMRLRVKYDIWYIRHWSFYLDLYIIVKTFFKCFGNDSNAY